MDIRIYIANLAAYNDGRLVGRWVDLPAPIEVLNRVIKEMTNDGMGDYAIHDYEAPFRISEYDNPFDLNNIAERINGVHEDDEVKELILKNTDTVEEALNILESGEYRVYCNVSNMEDVAREFLEESGLLSELPENLVDYFDFQAYGRDMSFSGRFLWDRGHSLCVELFN